MRLRGYVGRPNPPVSDDEVQNASGVDAGAVGVDERVDDERYRLISIDPVRAPEGCSGSDWHVYRIAQGVNAITGYRRGDFARVTVDVETIVTALNGRRRWAKDKALSKSERRAAAAARAANAK